MPYVRLAPGIAGQGYIMRPRAPLPCRPRSTVPDRWKGAVVAGVCCGPLLGCLGALFVWLAIFAILGLGRLYMLVPLSWIEGWQTELAAIWCLRCALLGAVLLTSWAGWTYGYAGFFHSVDATHH